LSPLAVRFHIVLSRLPQVGSLDNSFSSSPNVSVTFDCFSTWPKLTASSLIRAIFIPLLTPVCLAQTLNRHFRDGH
jgi:hypothetical protein